MNHKPVGLFICVLVALQFAVNALAATDRAQFNSDNASVILGLHGETSIDKKAVINASRRLLSEFHPDKVSKAEEGEATRITQKINEARKALLKFLDVNPNFNPSQSTTTSRSQNNTAGSNYSWEQSFTDVNHPRRTAPNTHAGTDLVRDRHFRIGFENTWFDVLNRVNGLHEAYFILNGRSFELSQNYDLLLVIRPDTFPNIEARLLVRGEGDAPRLSHSFEVRYEVGGHAGVGGRRWDVLRFADGTYLVPPADMHGPQFDGFNLENLTTDGKRVAIKPVPGWHQFFAKMSYDSVIGDYVASGEGFLAEVSPRSYMPENATASTLPAWKNLAISDANRVILLGRSCESLFRP